MLIGHMLPLTCYRKKLQNLSTSTVAPKVYKITDLNELKQRLRTKWA